MTDQNACIREKTLSHGKRDSKDSLSNLPPPYHELGGVHAPPTHSKPKPSPPAPRHACRLRHVFVQLQGILLKPFQRHRQAPQPPQKKPSDAASPVVPTESTERKASPGKHGHAVTHYAHVQGDPELFKNRVFKYVRPATIRAAEASCQVDMAIPIAGTRDVRVASFRHVRRIDQREHLIEYVDFFTPLGAFSLSDIGGLVPACPRCAGSWPPSIKSFPDTVNRLPPLSPGDASAKVTITCFACKQQYLTEAETHNHGDGSPVLESWLFVFSRYFDVNSLAAHTLSLDPVYLC